MSEPQSDKPAPEAEKTNARHPLWAALRRVLIVLFTHERHRRHHWGVTVIGFVAIAVSIYILFGMSNRDYGPQIICHAAMLGEPDIVAKLLYRDANLRSARVRGLTVLHWAVAGGSLDTVKVVVTHGADVNATDSEGVTPLHIAAVQGFSYISEYLLEKGADVNPKDRRGATPLDWALARSQSDVIELLRAHGAVNAKPAPGTDEPAPPEEEEEKSAPDGSEPVAGRLPPAPQPDRCPVIPFRMRG